MAKLTPHYNLFSIVGIIRKVNFTLVWFIFSFSLLPELLNVGVLKHWDTLLGLRDIINVANMISIGVYFVLDATVNYVLIPQAENKRKDDFIDNSFGSTFSIVSSIEYYDNEEIGAGLYKGAVNLFQNCFFSASLMKAALPQKIVLPAIVLLGVMIMAYFGFKQFDWAVALLQTLFSVSILGGLIKDLILYYQLNSIQDMWVALFQNKDTKLNIASYHAQVYRYWLRYETLISWAQPDIPDTLYKRLNDPLTAEWQNLKIKYNIN
jgi:hypothetical protein